MTFVDHNPISWRRVSQKKWILLFRIFCGIIFLSLFHLETRLMIILNLNLHQNTNKCVHRYRYTYTYIHVCILLITYLTTIIHALFKVKRKKLSADSLNSNSQHKALNRIVYFLDSSAATVPANSNWVWTVSSSNFTSDGWDENQVCACILGELECRKGMKWA